MTMLSKTYNMIRYPPNLKCFYSIRWTLFLTTFVVVVFTLFPPNLLWDIRRSFTVVKQNLLPELWVSSGEQLVSKTKKFDTNFMPKIIHQIWFSSQNRSIPKSEMQYAVAWEKFATANQWEHRIWSLEQFKTFYRKEYSLTEDEYPDLPVPSGIFGPDFARILILCKLGGLYADVDTIPLNASLIKSISKQQLILTTAKPFGISSTFIGAMKNQKFICELADEFSSANLAQNRPSFVTNGVLHHFRVLASYGPMTLTQFHPWFERHNCDEDKISILDRQLQNQIFWHFSGEKRDVGRHWTSADSQVFFTLQDQMSFEAWTIGVKIIFYGGLSLCCLSLFIIGSNLKGFVHGYYGKSDRVIVLLRGMS